MKCFCATATVSKKDRHRSEEDTWPVTLVGLFNP
jgi:hypothetical protein